MGLSADIFVGRESELSQLREGLENARSGRGQFVLLAGEAGIGKSRLSDELSKIAESLSFEVAWGRCWESEGAPAYWPWTEALRGCLYEMRSRASSPVAGQSSTTHSEGNAPIPDSLVSRLERWLNQRKTNPTPSHQSQLIDSNDLIDSQQERSLLFESVLQLLTDISLHRPALLLFEDFHAADRDSILLLQFIARHIRSLHIMIVVTFRNEDRTTAAEGEDLLEALCREGKTLTISGLSAKDVNEVVKGYLGQANKSLSLELFNLTEGNPFFLTETVRLISSDKGRNKSSYRTLTDLDIPRSVRKTMHRRFQSISAAVRDLLTLASVIGREFDPDLLARVSGKSVEELLGTLDEAADAALIYPELTYSGKYQFRHALIAETLYDGIPTKVRRTLHLSIAGYLEDIHSANLDPYFSELAHHLLSALPIGDLEKAVKYAELGASRATNMLAYEEASRLYETALQALGTFVDPRQRCKLLLNLASARALAEDYVGARESCEEAASIARELALPAEFADATIYYGWQTSSFGTVDRKLVDMLEEALSLVGANGGAIRAILLARLAQELYWSDQVSRREELSAQSVAIARKTDDPGVIVRSLYSRYLALWNPENDQERFAVLKELIEVAEHNGLKNWRQRVSWPLIGELFGVGDVVGALAEMENIERLDTELKRQTGFPQAARAAWALLEGRFEEGERFAAMALDIAGPKNPAMAQIFASQISLVRREQGRMAELIPIVETIVSQAPRLTFARCGLASCYAESDKRAQAATEFEFFAANNFSTIPKDATWIASAVLLADVCCYLADSSRASILYQQLLPHSPRIAVLGSQVCYGAIEYYLGKLAFCMRHFETAERHFEAALRLNQLISARPWIAHSQFEYATLLQSQPGRREKGTALLRTSLELAEALGMKALISRIRKSEEVGGAVSPVAQRSPDTIGPSCALFLDIIDWVKLSRDVGDRALRDLLHRIHGIAHQQIRRLGAIEVEEHQDGLIAIFSMPSTAVSAASAISDSVARFKVATKAAIYAPQEGVTINEARALLDRSKSKLFSKANPGEIVLWSTSSAPVIDEAIQPMGSDTLDLRDANQPLLYFFRVELSDTSGSRKAHRE